MNISNSLGIHFMNGANIQHWSESEVEDRMAVIGAMNDKEIIWPRSDPGTASIFNETISSREASASAIEDNGKITKSPYRDMLFDPLTCISSFLDERSANEIATAFSGERK